MQAILIFSAIIVLAANVGVYYRGMRTVAVVLCIIGMLLAFLTGGQLLGMLSVLIGISLAVHEYCSRRWWRYPAISALAVALTFGISILLALRCLGPSTGANSSAPMPRVPV